MLLRPASERRNALGRSTSTASALTISQRKLRRGRYPAYSRPMKSADSDPVPIRPRRPETSTQRGTRDDFRWGYPCAVATQEPPVPSKFPSR
nr:hypothetical protein CFP56_09013 [Quercus suber]